MALKGAFPCDTWFKIFNFRRGALMAAWRSRVPSTGALSTSTWGKNFHNSCCPWHRRSLNSGLIHNELIALLWVRWRRFLSRKYPEPVVVSWSSCFNQRPSLLKNKLRIILKQNKLEHTRYDNSSNSGRVEPRRRNAQLRSELGTRVLLLYLLKEKITIWEKKMIIYLKLLASDCPTATSITF